MASADTSTLGVSILIPAFDEEGAIEETVKKIGEQRAFFREIEIVVINDGSADRTGEIARGLPVTLLEHPSNRGYGAALKTGLQRAKHEIIIIADADGTYPLEDIPKLAADMGEFAPCRHCSFDEGSLRSLLTHPVRLLFARLCKHSEL